MLDDHPILKDRLQACATFSGIAIAGVAGFELVISGGFDFLTPGREVREVAPSAYVTVYRQPWSPEARVIPLASREPLFAGEIETPSDRLAGGYDDATAPDGAYPESDDRQLYADIEALYAGEIAPAMGAAAYEPVQYNDAQFYRTALDADPYVAAAEADVAAEDVESKPKDW